jgi:hypothetical protein
VVTRRFRALLSSLLELAGASLLVYGIATVSTTAALIVSGVLLTVAGAVLGSAK